MQALEELAKEYLENVARLEKRIAELEHQEKKLTSCQDRLLLRRRIAILVSDGGRRAAGRV